jgi:hypothetical protein
LISSSLISNGLSVSNFLRFWRSIACLLVFVGLVMTAAG